MRNLPWIKLFFITLLGISALQAQNETVIKNGDRLYLSNTVIIKQKQSSGADGSLSKVTGISASLQQKLSVYGVSQVQRTFNTAGNSLSGITTIKYNSGKDPMTVAAELEKSGEVEWAEPHYVYRMTSMPGNPLFPAPNDPSYQQQWWLTKIQALQAWDINSGDTNMVIAIVDCGVERNHSDLSRNIWTNRKEIPGNGIDDDKNGYIDDTQGWDFGGLTGTPDNNPDEDRAQHGTHVAGIASAVSNNGVGIASIGYKCKIMAVKTSRDDRRDGNNNAYIWYGYEGIVYAADNGAKVINCSWGGPGYSRAGEEVINYAISRGALVAVSAGNDNTDSYDYPAAYSGVLAVASTNNYDQRSYYSNYGAYISVCAPGENIYSTWQPGMYANLSGTSMASPLAAGLAALVRSQFPQYMPSQVIEQIRVNSDNIDAQNSGFQYDLGAGRINAYKALSNTASKSVRATGILFSDEAPGGNGNGIFEPGETISLSANFMNYLSPISGIKITLEPMADKQTGKKYAEVINGSFTSGSAGTLGSFNNNSSRFTFKIASDVPENTTIEFLIKYSDNSSYNDFQWTKVLVSPSFADMKGGNVSLTITSRGGLGFNDYPDDQQGTGFRYKNGPNLLFEGAFMYGSSASKIADAARNFEGQDTSFAAVQPFMLRIPGSEADYQGTGIFNDSRTPSDSYGIETKLTSYSYADAPNDKFIILKYSMTNKSGADISNLYAGLFFDWDVNADSADKDIANYDNTDNFGYAYSTLGRPGAYAGCALISSDKYGYYAMRNDGQDGGIGIYYQSGTTMNGYTKAEKWATLSSGIGKKLAQGGDISMVVSGGPFAIAKGQALDVVYAAAGGDNLEDLRGAIKSSRAKFRQILTAVDDKKEAVPERFALEQNYPNPFNPSTTIYYQIPEDGQVVLSVYNILGEKVANLVNAVQSKGSHKVSFDSSINNITSGVYFYRIEFANQVLSRKMVLIK
ncbi:MAG: S8 family serine peptidase [Bacillota bacterium]